MSDIYLQYMARDFYNLFQLIRPPSKKIYSLRKT